MEPVIPGTHNIPRPGAAKRHGVACWEHGPAREEAINVRQNGNLFFCLFGFRIVQTA